jgi:polyphosphate glucokinase
MDDHAPTTDHIQEPLTLSIDIGGSHLKAGLLDATGTLIGERRRAETPTAPGPTVVIECLTTLLNPLPPAHRVSVGFPGVVRDGVVLTAPNLGSEAWRGFPLAERLAMVLGMPVRVMNDASVQGLGSIAGRGLECVITLGTGMGFALFADGAIAPHLEVSQHPIHKNKTYDDYIGDEERDRIGNKHWNRRMRKVIDILRTVVMFDVLLIGGGNAKYLNFDLPEDIRLIPNEAGVTGGIRLWGE